MRAPGVASLRSATAIWGGENRQQSASLPLASKAAPISGVALTFLVCETVTGLAWALNGNRLVGVDAVGTVRAWSLSRASIHRGDLPLQPQPGLSILDMAFPDADGRDVLARLKTDTRTAHIPGRRLVGRP